MLSAKEFISFFIHCAHSFSSISFFHIKSSFGQTLRGNKHCCIHRFPNSISQLATLPCQASSRFTMASPISPPPQLLSKKKSGLAKTGKCKKTNPPHQELSMPGLCCRGGCPAAKLPPAVTSPTRRRALEGPRLAADLLSDGLLLRENPQAEICLLVRLKRGGNKNVITRRQLESVRYFP